jgi:hypothetical protein
MAWNNFHPNMAKVGEFEKMKLKGNFCLYCGFQQKETSEVLQGR